MTTCGTISRRSSLLRRFLAAILAVLFLVPSLPHHHECEHTPPAGVVLGEVETDADDCPICWWMVQSHVAFVSAIVVICAIRCVDETIRCVWRGHDTFAEFSLLARPPPG